MIDSVSPMMTVPSGMSVVCGPWPGWANAAVAVNPIRTVPTEPAWIRRTWLFREPAAQPIVTVGYRDRIPPLETGVPGLVLANTTQVYPEDRGTNYAVRLGREAAARLLAAWGHAVVVVDLVADPQPTGRRG